MPLFKKSTFGLHIGDTAIRAVELLRAGRKIQMSRFIKIGLADRNDDKELLTALNKIKKSLNLSSAFISPFNPSLFHLLGRAKIKPLSFETELEAAARSVLSKGDSGACMLLDVGKKKTSIAIVSNGVPCYSHSLDISDILLSEAAYRSSGPEIFYNQINKHYILWHLDKGNKIQKIIIYGNSANLQSLRDSLALNMRTEVELADVWANIVESFDDEIPSLPFDESLGYATAIGLALKGR